MDIKQIKEQIGEHDIRTVIVAGTDAVGTLRGKRLTVPYFLKSAEQGLNFAWFILMTTTVDDVLPGLFDTGIHDLKGKPDLSTFRIAPWEEKAAIVLMDWYWTDGTRSSLCPRGELKRQVEKLQSVGLRESFALETEFFLMPKPIKEIRRGGWNDLVTETEDIHCYSIYEGHFHEAIVSKIREYFSTEVEACIPEWGLGQFEINLHHSDAVSMADTAVLFKTAIKQIAAQEGYSVTFMAKWHEQQSGSSGHIHQSLAHIDTGESACFDESQPNSLSQTFQHFIAGQLDTFREMTLFLAPFVNSYKRFQEDSFAGTTCSWGIDNRTTALRVINNDASKCRLEHRVGGADLNPYTAFAACLGSGLHGIEKKLPLAAPHTGNAYQADVESVPMSLNDAIKVTDSSPLVRQILNPEFVDNIVKIARFECEVFNTTVTDLERRRYFEMV